MSPNVSDSESEGPGRKQRFLLALLTAPTIEEACKVAGIDRRDCRADARERFSADRMVADYEHLYQSITDQR